MAYRLLIAGWLVLALSGPARAQAPAQPTQAADRVFAALVPVNLGLGIVDARRTVRCVEQFPGRCVEANPLFNAIAVSRGIRGSMTVKVAADVGVTIGTAWALHRWRHQKWAIVAGYAANAAIKGWVIRYNRRVMERLAP
jgi:hypothetical protein